MKKLLVLLFGILAIAFQASAGSNIVSMDLFSYTGIQARHDLLNDSAHYSIAVPAELPAGNSWSGAAGSITYDEDTQTWYISVRQRGDNVRGDLLQVWSSPDLSSWTKVWEIDKNNVANRTVNSFEVTSIRKYEGRWYFYFGWTNPGENWKIDVVYADTVEDLAAQMLDGNNWHPILWGTRHTKDPRVYFLDGKYYLIYNDNGTSIRILVDSTPDFANRTVLTDSVISSYKALYPIYGISPTSSVNIGPIFWDATSQHYIFWAKTQHGTNIYWAWFISDDLVKWTFVERKIIFENYQGYMTTARYFDYYAFDASHYVLIMEWDPEQDSSGDLYLWNYTQ